MISTLVFSNILESHGDSRCVRIVRTQRDHLLEKDFIEPLSFLKWKTVIKIQIKLLSDWQIKHKNKIIISNGSWVSDKNKTDKKCNANLVLNEKQKVLVKFQFILLSFMRILCYNQTFVYCFYLISGTMYDDKHTWGITFIFELFYCSFFVLYKHRLLK